MRCSACFLHYNIVCQHLTRTKAHQIQLINDSFSSQTMAIYLPKRKFKVKSIWCLTWPTKVRCQNPVYVQYCQAPGPSLDEPGPWPGQPGLQNKLTEIGMAKSSLVLVTNLTKPSPDLDIPRPGLDTIFRQATTHHPTPYIFMYSIYSQCRIYLFNWRNTK